MELISTISIHFFSMLTTAFSQMPSWAVFATLIVFIIGVLFNAQIQVLSMMMPWNKGKSKHTGCAFRGSLLNFEEKCIDYFSYLNSYRDNLVRDQMSYAEDQTKIIIDLLENSFIKTAQEHAPEDANILEMPCYNNFILVMAKFETVLKNAARSHFKDPSFPKMSQDEAEKKASDKKQVMRLLGSDTITQFYKSSQIPRDLIFKNNIILNQTIESIIYSIYIHAWKKCQEYKIDLEKKRIAYEEARP